MFKTQLVLWMLLKHVGKGINFLSLDVKHFCFTEVYVYIDIAQSQCTIQILNRNIVKYFPYRLLVIDLFAKFLIANDTAF